MRAGYGVRKVRGVLRRVEHVVEVMERGLTDMDGVACSYSSLES